MCDTSHAISRNKSVISVLSKVHCTLTHTHIRVHCACTRESSSLCMRVHMVATKMHCIVYKFNLHRNAHTHHQHYHSQVGHKCNAKTVTAKIVCSVPNRKQVRENQIDGKESSTRSAGGGR